MSSLNRIILVGTVITEPETKTTNEGSIVSNFSIGVDRSDRIDGISKTDFINIVAWRNTAELIKNQCKKDNLVLIEGKIITRTFDDDKGQRKWVTEVEANQFKLLLSVKQNENNISNTNADKEISKKNNSDAKLEKKENSTVNEMDFDFNDKPFSLGQQDIQTHPKFGEEIEEDIPF